LVAFWSNHFTVSRTKSVVAGLAGPFEIEAIRPNLRDSFENLLIAAETHPAMLIYLDQTVSRGPNSRLGRKRRLGLNENLAREILELHTLSVHGGYTQIDVTSFAKIMTGWTVSFDSGISEYKSELAEPGGKTLLGRGFSGSNPSRDDYLNALRFLASQPATARHIATKLVRHFIADDPPKAAVEATEKAFLRSGGKLLVVYDALFNAAEAWDPGLRKARNDEEFVIACVRAANVPKQNLAFIDEKQSANPLTVGAVSLMQQRIWTAPSPAGWPEAASEWLSPTGLAQRLAYIPRIVAHIQDRDVGGFLDRILGPLASKQTRDIVGSASSRDEGLALVLASPEFNRR
jgi:uncharacterized protein (DUF1800 family)